MAAQLDDQRDLIGNARSNNGQLLSLIAELYELRESYDALGLADDSILDDAALIPLGTTRADLRAARATWDMVLVLFSGAQLDRLTRFARGI